MANINSAASSQRPEKPAHLEPSELGTKQYWDELYTTELTNHAANPADEGIVWFDDSDAEAKVVAFLDGSGAGLGRGLDKDAAAVLDLGCGNGSLLFALRDDGWGGRLLGVDYSSQSVALAQRVAVARRRGPGQEEESEEEGEGAEAEAEAEVEFCVWDVLNGALDDVRASSPSPPSVTTPTTAGAEGGCHDNATAAAAGWDLVLDKGTFDAVSLSDERDARGRRICEGYGARVLSLLRTGGVFVVTSCNWTEAELREWFEPAPATTATAPPFFVLRQVGRIEYPSFSFGGVKGQTISTLCFEKVAVAVSPS
ncbi:methyltransferase domain-containing protein [Lasiosphaeria miniovina]|uniref:Protein-lysine N-methyltransferase EFM4 n=1 Tax=Lasiosphaeria miniovina TaxID=1954250 RepID=A0AA40AVK0_9PEZI|nr:methyltransferase domain-containing protein [Lasiosphaeria miniovina]KAK0722761.1 methyltransferase domain-containing protein [Lasiosphaeria miniovina]